MLKACTAVTTGGKTVDVSGCTFPQRKLINSLHDDQPLTHSLTSRTEVMNRQLHNRAPTPEKVRRVCGKGRGSPAFSAVNFAANLKRPIPHKIPPTPAV